jgi:hypothetical protein
MEESAPSYCKLNGFLHAGVFPNRPYQEGQLSFHLEHSARHSSTTSRNPSSPPCFYPRLWGLHIFLAMATWPRGMSGTGMNSHAEGPREERIHRGDRLAVVAFLSRRMACFVMIIMLLRVTSRDGPCSTLGRSCLPSMASGSNDDSRRLHVLPNIFISFMRGLRIACAAESKTRCGIRIVYLIAANSRITRLKGAIEGARH